ncbi:hypothetical protein D3C77_737270 [compost metagenome]
MRLSDWPSRLKPMVKVSPLAGEPLAVVLNSTVWVLGAVPTVRLNASSLDCPGMKVPSVPGIGSPFTSYSL